MEVALQIKPVYRSLLQVCYEVIKKTFIIMLHATADPRIPLRQKEHYEVIMGKLVQLYTSAESVLRMAREMPLDGFAIDIGWGEDRDEQVEAILAACRGA